MTLPCHAQSKADKTTKSFTPTVEEITVPGGKVKISTYDFSLSARGDIGWYDKNTLVLGIGGTTAQELTGTQDDWVAALRIDTHQLTPITPGRLVRIDNGIAIIGSTSSLKAYKCGPLFGQLQEAQSIWEQPCLIDQFGKVDYGNYAKRLPYSHPDLVKPNGQRIPINIAYEHLGRYVHNIPWKNAQLFVWRLSTIEDTRLYPELSQEECLTRLNQAQKDIKNPYYFRFVNLRGEEYRLALARSCRPLTPPNMFHILQDDGRVEDLPIPLRFKALFGDAHGGYYTRAGLVLSPIRLPPERSYLNGLWLATNDTQESLTQIYKVRTGVASLGNPTEVSQDGCRFGIPESNDRRVKALKVFNVCSD